MAAARRLNELGNRDCCGVVGGVEPLEARTLLAGFTLVTHGYQLSGNLPVWPGTLADAIGTRAGEGGAGWSRFDLGFTSSDFSTTWKQNGGPALTATRSGEAVSVLDWAADSNNVIDVTVRSRDVAWSTAQTLLSSGTNLLAGSIHLIGHSRGGDLVQWLAAYLGTSGIWVDHLTTLDPHPESFFGDVEYGGVSDNVVFADNYHQNLTDLLISGQAVPGATNVRLDFAPGRDIGHSAVHTYYHGSVDLAASSDGNGGDIDDDWYGSWPYGPASQVGFGWSRLGRAPRPGNSEHTPFTGGDRALLAEYGAQWPNVIIEDMETSSVIAGRSFSTDLLLGDRDSGMTVTLYADNDDNPYNGYVRQIGSSAYQQVDVGTTTLSASTANLAPGEYRIVAVVSDGQRSRYSYAKNRITIEPPPLISTFTAQSATVTRGTSLIVSVNTSPAAGVGGVEIWVDANDDGEFSAQIDRRIGGAKRSGSSLFTASVSTRGWTLGESRLFAVARPSGGGVWQSDSVDVQINNSLPTIGSISAKPSRVANRGDLVTLSSKSVKDADGTVSAVWYYLDADASNSFTVADVLLGSAGPGGKVGVSSLSFANGSNRVFALATDNDAGVSSPVFISLTLNIAPVVTSFTSSTATVVGNARFTLTAGGFDSDGTIKGAEFWLDLDGDGFIASGIDRLLGKGSKKSGLWALTLKRGAIQLGTWGVLTRVVDNDKSAGAAAGLQLTFA